MGAAKLYQPDPGKTGKACCGFCDKDGTLICTGSKRLKLTAAGLAFTGPLTITSGFDPNGTFTLTGNDPDAIPSTRNAYKQDYPGGYYWAAGVFLAGFLPTGESVWSYGATFGRNDLAWISWRKIVNCYLIQAPTPTPPHTLGLQLCNGAIVTTIFGPNIPAAFATFPTCIDIECMSDA